MDTSDVLGSLRVAGIRLRAEGGCLIAEPAGALTERLRAMIREYKPALLASLTDPHDMTRLFPSSLLLGSMVICRRCARFSARPGRQPDGNCTFYGDIWSAVPFPCSDYWANDEGRP
jgi:hypothetical protein